MRYPLEPESMTPAQRLEEVAGLLAYIFWLGPVVKQVELLWCCPFGASWKPESSARPSHLVPASFNTKGSSR